MGIASREFFFRRLALLALVAFTVIMASACTPEPVDTETIEPSISAVLAGGSMPEPALLQVAELVQQYGLTPTGAPQLTDEAELGSHDIAFTLYSEVSSAVGLDLASHEGEVAQWYSIPLAERTYEDTSITATFIICDDSVVGAGLYMENYTPGVVSLRAAE